MTELGTKNGREGVSVKRGSEWKKREESKIVQK